MWVVGQRVYAEFEPELGLGVVVEVIGARLIEVAFPIPKLRRRYSQAVAPLRRLVLNSGQTVRSIDGKHHTIAELTEVDGLFRYKTEKGAKIWEYDLSEIVENQTPITKFLTGQWSHPKAFHLREQAWKLRGKSLTPEIRGLVGSRVSLLPHQMGIATEIARREFPRCLLCDEVGLGKTIEAGLIFASLRALGRASRVLILVPEALEHQWIAEMYRRFHETFSLIDEERSEQETLSQGQSAFQMNQKVLCSIPFLTEHPEELEAATEEQWDLLIVDEAHRLEWNETDPSVEWEVIRLLSERSRGLLLLTATPLRQGIETQFGLLNLVDPQRFPDFASFKAQTHKMGETAALAKSILDESRAKPFLTELKNQFPKDTDLHEQIEAYGKGGASHELLEALVDRHGTGRVLVRNRRANIHGFPDRQLKFHPLPVPSAWETWLATLVPDKLDISQILSLAAGLDELPAKAPKSDWFQSRAAHLLKVLESNRKEKVLLICSSSRRVRDLQEFLRNNSSIRTAIFDENLEIIERDRQAAWFSQTDGAQVLLCSEIGGEGRNFQFCHHLYLFDLPTHPDVLEQRIGRLDRIGQKEIIQIHVPFLMDTPEEVLARWYDEGLHVYTQPWNGANLGAELQKRTKELLLDFLPKSKHYDSRKKRLTKLLKDTEIRATEIRLEQEKGVDLLIDINSANKTIGKSITEKISEVDDSAELPEFLEDAFDYFGVELDKLDDEGSLKLTAHSLTFVESFPGLSSNGDLGATYRRSRALTHEGLAFLSLEHTIVQGAFSLILEGDVGSITAGRTTDLKNSNDRLFLELLYVLQPIAPAYLEVERDLPLQVLKAFVNLEGKVIPAPKGLANATLRPIPHDTIKDLRTRLGSQLRSVMSHATEDIKQKASPLIQQSVVSYKTRTEKEISRLQQLAKINPLITPNEIKAASARQKAGIAALEATSARLDGIRLILSE